MTRSNHVYNNFVGGEINAKLHGRIELPLYAKSVAKLENFIVQMQGGVRKRNGNAFVHTTRLNNIGVLIPFQFNDQQSYLIEATDLKFRFYANNGVVLGQDALINQISNYNPGYFRVPAHGFIVNDQVLITGVNGMTGLNGTIFAINSVVDANRFTLKTLAGVPVDTRALGKYTSGGKASKVITINSITSANPAVVTANGHGFATNDEVYISSVQGLTQLNGRFFLVTVLNANQFTLKDIFGNVISTIGQGPYTTGGTVSSVYELTTPYLEQDLPFLQFTQDTDTMYITSQLYPPGKLTRISNANFTINNAFVRQADPFPGTDYPKTVALIPGNRLAYADTPVHPETVFTSKAPSTTNTAFDNFTAGINATDAVTFTLAPMQGKADTIQWIVVSNQYAIMGCFGSVRALYGASPASGIDPNDLNTPPINFFGCEPVRPVTTGETVFYIQRGQRIIRGTSFDFSVNNFSSTDMLLTADHLSVPLLQQIVFQQNFPDVLWAALGNGRMIGLTYSVKESIAGWHKHYIAGLSVDVNGNTQPYGKILSLGIMPRPAAPEQLWMIVERQIGIHTVRSVEYMTDPVEFPEMRNFFTGDKTGDTTRFDNARYEAQKDSNHLDMSILYDGSAQGQTTMKPNATTGNGITMTANVAFFTASMIGQQIVKRYDSNGNGGGKATIISITDSTHAVCNVIKDFDNSNTMAIGGWFLTATVLSGLQIWEGQTLQLVADGGPISPDPVVNAGSITLDNPATKVWAGYKFNATLESLGLDSGSTVGPAKSKVRRISKAFGEFLNTAGCKYGTDYYRLEPVIFRDDGDIADRPAPAKTKNIQIDYTDDFSRAKKFIVYSDTPVPVTLLGLDAHIDVQEDTSGER